MWLNELRDTLISLTKDKKQKTKASYLSKSKLGNPSPFYNYHLLGEFWRAIAKLLTHKKLFQWLWSYFENEWFLWLQLSHKTCELTLQPIHGCYTKVVKLSSARRVGLVQPGPGGLIESVPLLDRSRNWPSQIRLVRSLNYDWTGPTRLVSQK